MLPPRRWASTSRRDRQPRIAGADNTWTGHNNNFATGAAITGWGLCWKCESAEHIRAECPAWLKNVAAWAQVQKLGRESNKRIAEFEAAEAARNELERFESQAERKLLERMKIEEAEKESCAAGAKGYKQHW